MGDIAVALLWVGVATGASFWVHWDCRQRGWSSWAARGWSAGTFWMMSFVLPLYLLSRLLPAFVQQAMQEA